MNPSKRDRALFWIALGFLSSTMAEVISSSHPQGVFDLWGVLAIFPLYSLHILVLSGFLFRFGLNWQRLFLFGTLFGMYEGYITKVFWNPVWSAELEFLGVYWLQFFSLVLFWHPFFAFILPLLIAETLFTNSNFVLNTLKDMPLLGRIKRRVIFIFPLIFGLYQSSNTPAGTSLFFGILNLAAITFFYRIYRSQRRQYSLPELLPRGKELRILLSVLVLFYAFWTFAFNFEAIGGLIFPILVWSFYLLFFILILWNRKMTKIRHEEKPGISIFYANFMVYLASAIIFPALKPAAISIAFLLVGTAYGISLLISLLFHCSFQEKQHFVDGDG